MAIIVNKKEYEEGAPAIYKTKSDKLSPSNEARLSTHSESKFFPDQNSKPSSKSSSKPSSGRGGMSKKEYKAKYGESYDDGGSSAQEKALKKQKKAAEEARKKRENSYNKLYDTLRGNLVAQRGDVNTQRGNSLTGLEGDYNNAIDRMGRGKEEMTQYYDDQEGDLRNSYEDQRKERERIFQARNITNSSYYIDAVTEADTEFNKTLSRMGGDEARYLAEQDTQIKELGQTKMNKRGEIEMAYNQAMRQIENDLARTDFEKANAMQQLEDEYTSKMNTISGQLMEIQAQQQAFREKAAEMAVNGNYKNGNYDFDLNNDALKKNPAMTIQEAMAAGYLSGNTKKDDKNQFISDGRTLPQGAQPGQFVGNNMYQPSPDDVKYLGSQQTNTTKKTGRSLGL